MGPLLRVLLHPPLPFLEVLDQLFLLLHLELLLLLPVLLNLLVFESVVRLYLLHLVLQLVESLVLLNPLLHIRVHSVDRRAPYHQQSPEQQHIACRLLSLLLFLSGALLFLLGSLLVSIVPVGVLLVHLSLFTLLLLLSIHGVFLGRGCPDSLPAEEFLEEFVLLLHGQVVLSLGLLLFGEVHGTRLVLFRVSVLELELLLLLYLVISPVDHFYLYLIFLLLLRIQVGVVLLRECQILVPDVFDVAQSRHSQNTVRVPLSRRKTVGTHWQEERTMDHLYFIIWPMII